MTEHPPLNARALASVLAMLQERIDQHVRARRQHLPPSDPFPQGAAAWDRHDAAVEALQELYARLCGVPSDSDGADR